MKRSATAPHSSSSIDSWLTSGQIPLLDGLRAVAVIAVLMAHACQTHHFPDLYGRSLLLKHGELGVDLFFVISGFLITTLLIREHSRNGTVSLRKFFIRRSLRILPVYYCFLATVFLLQMMGTIHLQLADWIGALTYTTNFMSVPGWELGHVWSLSIEEHFYLLWPLCFVLLGAQRCGFAAIICLVVGLVCRLVLLAGWSDEAWMAGRYTFTRADAIALGCLMATVVQMPVYRRLLDRFCRIPMMPLQAVAGLVVSVTLCELSYRYKVAFGYTINGGLMCILLWSTLIRWQESSVQWLNSPVLRAIGVRSYSLYLWQQIFLNPNLDVPLTAFPVNLLLAFATAWVSYGFIEMPLQNLRHRFAAGTVHAKNPTAEVAAMPEVTPAVDDPRPAVAPENALAGSVN